MGTISTKINRINETKKEIAKAIQEKGIRVYDEDTFRSYAEKIRSLNTDNYDEDAEYADLNDPANVDDGTGGGTDAGDSTESTVKYVNKGTLIADKNGKYSFDSDGKTIRTDLTESDLKSIDNSQSWTTSTSTEYEKKKKEVDSKQKESDDLAKEISDLETERDDPNTTEERKQNIGELLTEKTGAKEVIDSALETGKKALEDMGVPDLAGTATATTTTASTSTTTDDDEEETEEIDPTTGKKKKKKKKKLSTTTEDIEKTYYWSKVVVNVTDEDEDEFTVSFWNDGEQLVLGEDDQHKPIKEKKVPRGGSVVFAGDVPQSDDPSQYFSGWNPRPVNIQGNTRCYAQFTGANMGYTKRSQYKEIEDDWETICSKGGAGYPIGSWKVLPIPNNLRFAVNEQRGYMPESEQGVIMMKVLEGEDESASTWISLNYVRCSTGLQQTGNASAANSNDNGVFYDYSETPLSNGPAENDGDYPPVYLNAPLTWNGFEYYTYDAHTPKHKKDVQNMNAYDDEYGDSYHREEYTWQGSYIRKWLQGEFFNSLPECLRSSIKSVKKKTAFYIPKSSESFNENDNSFREYQFEQGTKYTDETSDTIWIPSLYEIFGDTMKTPYEGAGRGYKGFAYCDGDGNNFIGDGEVTYNLAKTGDRLFMQNGNDIVRNGHLGFQKIPFGWELPASNPPTDDFPTFESKKEGPYYPQAALMFSRNTSVYGTGVGDQTVNGELVPHHIEGNLYGWIFGNGEYYGEDIAWISYGATHYGMGFFARDMSKGFHAQLMFGFCLKATTIAKK